MGWRLTRIPSINASQSRPLMSAISADAVFTLVMEFRVSGGRKPINRGHRQALSAMVYSRRKSNTLVETLMKTIYRTVMVLGAALLITGTAHAQVTLNSVRIGAKDTVA